MIDQFLELLTPFIAFGIPECIALTTLTITLLRLRFAWKKIFLISAILWITVFIVRLTLVPEFGEPGINTPAAIFTLTFSVAYFFEVPKLQSLISSIIVFLINTLYQLAIYKTFFILLELDMNTILQNKTYWFSANWLINVALLLTSFLITRTGWYNRVKAIDGYLITRSQQYTRGFFSIK